MVNVGHAFIHHHPKKEADPESELLEPWVSLFLFCKY